MGALERADLPWTIRAEKARLATEQLDLHAFRRHGRGIDHHERQLRALGIQVDQPGHDLLANPRRAGDQHPASGRRHPLDGGAHLLDRRGLADQLQILADFQLELGILPLQPRCFPCAINQHQEPVGIEGLFQKVIRPLLDRGDGGLDGAVTANHDHRDLGACGLDIVQNLETVHGRTLKPDIQKDQARRTGFDLGKTPRPVAGMSYRKVLVLQDPGNRLSDLRLVIDDEYFALHSTLRNLVNNFGVTVTQGGNAYT